MTNRSSFKGSHEPAFSSAFGDALAHAAPSSALVVGWCYHGSETNADCDDSVGEGPATESVRKSKVQPGCAAPVGEGENQGRNARRESRPSPGRKPTNKCASWPRSRRGIMAAAAWWEHAYGERSCEATTADAMRLSDLRPRTHTVGSNPASRLPHTHVSTVRGRETQTWRYYDANTLITPVSLAGTSIYRPTCHTRTCDASEASHPIAYQLPHNDSTNTTPPLPSPGMGRGTAMEE